MGGVTMIELYQFEMSHYAEKVRLILDYKGLEYRKIEVTPGIGQLDVMRLSGQRQVPVLKDGSEVIADSTAIAEYLDKTYPERLVIPNDPKLRGLCLIMEQWADEVFGINARKCLISAISQDPSFRAATLPASTPDLLKNLVSSVPGDLFGGLGVDVIGLKAAKDAMKRDLAALCFILLEQPYLITDQPTLADFAVAGLSMYVKFPTGNYLDIPSALRGKGTPDIATIGTFEPFFTWRDRLYADYRKLRSPGDSGSGGGPTAISID
jgi:glutathione S-transferase